MASTPSSWPNGKKMPILVGVNLETWSDAKGPDCFPRTTPLKSAVLHQGAIQWGEYGVREEIYCLIRVLDRNGIKTTIFCSGRVAEKHPEAIHRIVASDHSVEAHGWAQEQMLFNMMPEEQRSAIRRTLDELDGVSGRQPQGWVTPACGGIEHTSDLLAQEGLVWSTDGLDRNLAWRAKTKASSIFRVPWSDYVDNRTLRSNPRDYQDVFHETFQFPHTHEPRSLLHIAAHTYHSGAPYVAARLDKLLRQLSQFKDV